MTILRGRAATPIRPGLVIKEILAGREPLSTGEIVTEAAIVELHATYRELIKRENSVRPRAKHLRGMTYPSFLKLFKFAQLLHLVEFVREEPMEFPPPSGDLYSVRKPNGIHAVVSTRRIFKITDVGMEDEKSWTDLRKAWQEGWPAPQKVEYIPPPPTKRPPRKVVPEVPPEEVPVFKHYPWHDEPSLARVRGLAAYLRDIDLIGVDKKEVSDEVEDIYDKMIHWITDIDDALEDARAINYFEEIHRLDVWIEHIATARDYLSRKELTEAAEELDKIVR